MTNSTILKVDFERDDPNEFTVVEQPLLAQLGMGWDYVAGDIVGPLVHSPAA